MGTWLYRGLVRLYAWIAWRPREPKGWRPSRKDSAIDFR